MAYPNRLSFPLAAVLINVTVAAGLGLAASGRRAESLDPLGRQVFQEAMRLADSAWDDRAALVNSLGSESPRRGGSSHRHLVRETSWYASGLLFRDGPGDRERAIRALNAVLNEQINEPGERWHGTFYRAPEEPRPLPSAQMWVNYDPNWRSFIGTTFSVILIEFPDRLPKSLIDHMEASIRMALQGEMHEGRLLVTYTNISLMYGFLLDWAGRRFSDPDFEKRAAAWNAEVYRNFKRHGTFDEYNSPTYCGVDLYGLALWRLYGSPAMRGWGTEMEAGLWRDLALFYHAGLRNLSGPYDRSYGMDMTRYVSLVGLWLRTVLPPESAPLPAIAPNTDHDNDMFYAPLYLILGTRIPAGAMKQFAAFAGERQVERAIDNNRVATAWIGPDRMLGGEMTHRTRDARPNFNQFHPATVHWKLPDGQVGWIRLIESPRVDARAAKDRLSIEAIGDCRFRVWAPGADAANIAKTLWKLPGLTLAVDSDAMDMGVQPAGDALDIVYRAQTRMTLTVQAGSGR